MTVFLFRYRYQGAEYGFEVPAEDVAEAKARVTAMAWAQLDGELVAKIPAAPGAGLLVRAVTALRNWLKGPFP